MYRPHPLQKQHLRLESFNHPKLVAWPTLNTVGLTYVVCGKNFFCARRQSPMTSVHAPSSSGPAVKVVCAARTSISAPGVIADQLIVEGVAGSEIQWPPLRTA